MPAQLGLGWHTRMNRKKRQEDIIRVKVPDFRGHGSQTAAAPVKPVGGRFSRHINWTRVNTQPKGRQTNVVIMFISTVTQSNTISSPLGQCGKLEWSALAKVELRLSIGHQHCILPYTFGEASIIQLSNVSVSNNALIFC